MCSKGGYVHISILLSKGVRMNIPGDKESRNSKRKNLQARKITSVLIAKKGKKGVVLITQRKKERKKAL